MGGKHVLESVILVGQGLEKIEISDFAENPVLMLLKPITWHFAGAVEKRGKQWHPADPNVRGYIGIEPPIDRAIEAANVKAIADVSVSG